MKGPWPILDALALSGLALGLLLILQPFWGGGFRAGFFLLLAATALHTITSRRTKDQA